MHFPSLQIVAWERGKGRERGREERDKEERIEKVPWAPSHCLSGMLITSHLPLQPRDGYVSSEHLLFKILVLALFPRRISSSVFFHL